MATIGEDIFTILGMIPTRDRAGIPRGTMAQEAAKSEAAAPAMAGAAAPPDITLPDNVPTEYASSRGAPWSPPPAPRERVVAASPAAAPSPAVQTRASDIMLEAMERRERQRKMMGVIGSLGMIANAFNRNPDSQVATRASLSGMISGGGHGDGGLGDIKTLSDMRAAEDTAIANAAKREQAITHSMQADGLSRERATVLYDTGNLAKRYEPDNLRKEQEWRDTEARKAKLRALIPRIAKARGTDPAVLEVMVDKDPDAVAKMAEAEGLEELSKKRTDNRINERKDLLEEVDVMAWARHAKEPQTLKDAYPDIEPNRIDEALKSPTQYRKLMEELTSKGSTGTLDPLTNELIQKQLVPSKLKTLEVAKANAVSNREMQNLWTDKLQTGSPHLSEFLHELKKSWGTITGRPFDPNTIITEKMIQQQVGGTLAVLSQLGAGTALSNADREYAARAQGGFTTTPETIRYLLYLKERENNYNIAKHNEEIDKVGSTNRYVKNNAPALKVDYPEPNRFTREIVAERKLDKFIEASVRNGTENDPATRELFEKDKQIGVGPGVFDHLVKEERARQGKK